MTKIVSSAPAGGIVALSEDCVSLLPEAWLRERDIMVHASALMPQFCIPGGLPRMHHAVEPAYFVPQPLCDPCSGAILVLV